MKKYYGNHLGIVIQNNDPDKAGKIKVFVPHISSTIYNNWIKKSENKALKFIDNKGTPGFRSSDNTSDCKYIAQTLINPA